MKKPNQLLSCVFVLFVIPGCTTLKAGKNTLEYHPPKPTKKPNNEIVINGHSNIVWDRLVSRLASSFFVVNNIDKASRFINLSLSSDSPEKYIDCGESIRGYFFKNEDRKYNYKMAQDTSYRIAGKWGAYNNLPAEKQVYRDASLDGRINIYVAPESQNTTKLSVNIRYLFSVKTFGKSIGYDLFGGHSQTTELPVEHDEMAFTTQQPTSKFYGFATVTCKSIGALEKYVLDMASEP